MARISLTKRFLNEILFKCQLDPLMEPSPEERPRPLLNLAIGQPEWKTYSIIAFNKSSPKVMFRT